jgi:predicted aspartyl protease
MGTFQVEIEVGDPKGERWERLSATAGTRAVFLVAPREFLERLGVKPRDRAPFRLPDGTLAKKDIGHTWVRIGSASVIAIVVFGSPDDAVVIGHNTLLGLGLEADTDKGQLAEATLYRLTKQVA